MTTKGGNTGSGTSRGDPGFASSDSKGSNTGSRTPRGDPAKDTTSSIIGSGQELVESFIPIYGPYQEWKRTKSWWSLGEAGLDAVMLCTTGGAGNLIKAGGKAAVKTGVKLLVKAATKDAVKIVEKSAIERTAKSRLAKAGDDLFVGTYKDINKANLRSGLGNTHSPHHVVQNAVSPRAMKDGVSINIRRDLHKQTRTYLKRVKPAPNLRTHLSRDIRDLRGILKNAGYGQPKINRQLQELIRQNKRLGGFEK